MNYRKTTIAEALKLAENPNSQEWKYLLARMEAPEGPWKHQMWHLPAERVTGLVHMLLPELHGCCKCKAQSRVTDTISGTDCSIPDPVTEPLPCLVDRRLKSLLDDKEILGRGFAVLGGAIKQVTRCRFGAEQFAWWVMATPAQQLVCLWTAERRLGE